MISYIRKVWSNRTSQSSFIIQKSKIIILALPILWLCWPPSLFDVPYSTVMEDRIGRLQGVTLAGDDQWRFPPSQDIPKPFIQAITIFEDARFFDHYGVDPVAVIRAAWSNVRSGRIISGASTLSMQVIRLSRKGQPRTLIEKGIEAILAIRLELHRSKADILAMYAAHAPFGGNVVGLETASWRYFGRGPDKLSWAETAMLAVLPNNPSLIHPGRNRDRLLTKRNDLLNQLWQADVLDSLTCALAKQEMLPPAPRPFPRYAPHLLTRLKNTQKSRRIQTTLRQDIQENATRIVDRHHNMLSGNGIRNAAALIMEVNTGHVVAYVGNVSEKVPGSYVDLITARRSTGSILKPMLYAGMLQYGDLLPDALVPDVPLRIGGFAPQNYDKSFVGAIPASQALARSLNVPAVHMLHTFGVDRFYTLLNQLGMSTLHRPARDYGLSLIIGGAEGTLWDITRMYAGLARRINVYGSPEEDLQMSPRLVIHADHKKTSGKTPLTPGVCWLTLDALLEVSRPGIDNAWRHFSSSQKIAWKTGTSQGFRDAWAIGVTPEYAVGVWVGNADGEGRPGLVGGQVAAPILFDLFDILDTGHTWFERPEADLRQIDVCAQSGYRAGPNCEVRRTAFIPEAGLDTAGCPYCTLIHRDHSQQFRVHSDCERVADMTPAKWFVLPPDQAWYYKEKHAGYKSLPPFRGDCLHGEDEQQTMTLLYPTDKGQLYVPVELDGRKGRIVFVAAHRQPASTIFWHLNDTYLGSTNSIHQMALAPAPGTHTLTLVDEKGFRLVRKFTIVDGSE